MKQQLEQSRQGLIANIELKLSQLKQQRDSMLNTKNPNNDKVKISNYLQNQNTIHPQRDIQKDINLQSPEVFSNKDMVEHRLAAKQKCEELKQLYERKRQLQQAGIHAASPNQIKKMYQNKEAVAKLKKDIVKNKKKEQEKLEKQKIIQQQLSKVQSFLQQSKKTNKAKSLQSQYRYSQLLKEHQQRLYRYEQLLSRKKITLSQKEELLQMTFRLIKESPQRVTKQYLQQFLLANHQFCKIFYITKEQIMRDLKVHKTEQDLFLNYQQFYQFIKSIQITNKAIKPNLNYERKQKATKANDLKAKFSDYKRNEEQQQMQKYLKKIFVYLDQKRQKIVQRERIEIAFSKCMLYDQKKMNFKKEVISNFGLFVKEERKRQEGKKYYKQLDLKYIGLDQLLKLYSSFRDKHKQQAPSIQSQSQPQQQQQYYQQQEQVQMVFAPQKVQIQQSDTRTDFEKYGWGESQSAKAQFSHLNQLDQYYKGVTNKYGNQIHWNNHKVYQQDFKKFNQAISKMKQHRSQDSKEVAQLFIRQPVLQVEDDRQEDFD